MRSFGRRFVASLLALSARGVIRRYHPTVIMVTGSVGKTSTKDAIAAALSARFLVRKSSKSANSEFGVPFTILGVENPWLNLGAWIRIALRALALLVLPNHYPNLLILEVGADHPGDLAKITRIVRPDAVVVTKLPEIPVHVEFYDSPAAVREEEFSPAHALTAGSPLIIPADDPYAVELASGLPARLVTYGFSPRASVRLEGTHMVEENGQIVGMAARALSGAGSAELLVRSSIGRVQLLATVAALATALAFDILPTAAAAALASYEPPPGRGRLLSGMNNSTIIDDSYNASPAAVEESLETLASFPHARRRIAVLGDMLELGRYSVMEHARIGAQVSRVADLLVTVGIRAKGIAVAAIASGMSGEAIHSFEEAHEVATWLIPQVIAGDVILVKGSQSIRLERVVEQLLADPADRMRLVRQEPAWRKRQG